VWTIDPNVIDKGVVDEETMAANIPPPPATNPVNVPVRINHVDTLSTASLALSTTIADACEE
jgi:hypothetical protein